MNKRKVGDKFLKRANAGFIGPALYGMIPDYPENSPEEMRRYGTPCLLGCGDDSCMEWPTLVVAYSLADLDSSDMHAFHVSECQMDDLP